MAKSRRRSALKTRWYILFGIVTMSILLIVYEIAIFCLLDGHLNESRNVYVKHELGNLNELRVDNELPEFKSYRKPDLKELENKEILSTVHYVWCKNTTLGFRQYLGILSVVKILQPDVLEFHHEFPLQSDKYNDWIDELRRSVPGFVTKGLPSHWDGEENGCGYQFGLAVLDDRGGIYVADDVIITDKIIPYVGRKNSIFLGNTTSGLKLAVAMTTDHFENFRKFRRNFGNGHKIQTGENPCGIIGDSLVMNGTGSFPCYVLERSLHPLDLMTLDTTFGEFTRTLLYGSPRIVKARALLPGTIPRIVHYVWYGSKEMDFMMYLSMLSTLFIVNPEKVYIHGDKTLTGRYLDMVLKDKRVVQVLREKPFTIFGHKVLYTQHRSDIVRADVLLKYGGIYMDWDVLWLRSPDELFTSGYDAILNVDHMSRMGFPDTFNLGVLMAKPRAAFIKKWQDALLNYRSEDFYYNAIELPYKIYEKYPETVRIDRRLQVMCFHLKCHPTFHSDFKSFNREQPFDWKKDVFSIHFTYPDPPEFESEERCRNGTGTFADIGKYILQHAHIGV